MPCDVTRDQIADGLAGLGVRQGDAVLAHSSLSAFGHIAGGAQAVVDALLDAVGESGTAVVPTHTWDTVNAANPIFDVRDTPSGVGLVTETFRRQPQAHRGLHPTHSCAAIGPLARSLSDGHEAQVTPCGSKSPYQRLMDCGGKIALLGVTLRVNTSFHALEEQAAVPWLFDRFQMLYSVDQEGLKIPVPSRRHAGGLERAFTAMEPVLLEGGALRSAQIGQATVRVVDAARMRALILPMLARDPFCLLAPGPAERERERYECWCRQRDAQP